MHFLHTIGSDNYGYDDLCHATINNWDEKCVVNSALVSLVGGFGARFAALASIIALSAIVDQKSFSISI